MESVAVVIPCFNHGNYLGQAIESVLAQTPCASQLIVVDDGSTDNTSEVAHLYPVEYLYQPHRGLSEARNHGMSMSRADYVVFLDADDRLLPNHFATSLRAFKSHPHVGLVCGRWRILDSGLPAVHNCTPRPDHFATLLAGNFIAAIHTAMFRRSAIVDVGGFDSRLRACEDYELYFRLLRRYPMYCHHETVAEYRQREDQMSRRWDLMLETSVAVLRKQYRYVRGNALYEIAYRHGLRDRQREYGDPLAWQLAMATRARDWPRIFRFLNLLVRQSPASLYMLFHSKLRKWRDRLPQSRERARTDERSVV